MLSQWVCDGHMFIQKPCPPVFTEASSKVNGLGNHEGKVAIPWGILEVIKCADETMGLRRPALGKCLFCTPTHRLPQPASEDESRSMKK